MKKSCDRIAAVLGIAKPIEFVEPKQPSPRKSMSPLRTSKGKDFCPDLSNRRLPVGINGPHERSSPQEKRASDFRMIREKSPIKTHHSSLGEEPQTATKFASVSSNLNNVAEHGPPKFDRAARSPRTSAQRKGSRRKQPAPV